jgi:hypothetical protein
VDRRGTDVNLTDTPEEKTLTKAIPGLRLLGNRKSRFLISLFSVTYRDQKFKTILTPVEKHMPSAIF